MRLETAMRRYLLQQTSITSLVQQRVWKNQPEEQLDQTGRAGITVRTAIGWSGMDLTQTLEFPRLLVDATADPTRDAAGMIVSANATDRAFAIAEILKPLLTYPNLRGVEIGAAGDRPGVVIVSSKVYVEPRTINQTDYHTVFEKQKQGDTVTVRTEFAIEMFSGG